jgi:hypothetical protein
MQEDNFIAGQLENALAQSKKIIVKKARQVGWTTNVINFLLNQGKKSLIVCPTTAVCKNVKKRASEYDNIIVCTEKTLAVSTCSYAFDYIVFDECAYFEDLEQTLLTVVPSMSNECKIILASSIGGNSVEKFEEIFQTAVDLRGDYHPIYLPWYVCHSRERMKMAQMSLGREIFEREYLGNISSPLCVFCRSMKK